MTATSDLTYSQYDLEHLPFRLWVGLWMSVILVTVCVFNGSYLVVFITRFTEELFASFIAVIFIIGAFQKIYAVGVKFPISPSREALTTTAAVSTPVDYAVHLVERTDGRGGWECSFERGAATGTNCIKIGLPGKSILGDYFQENMTSR